jgi:hypothetical protein
MHIICATVHGLAFHSCYILCFAHDRSLLSLADSERSFFCVHRPLKFISCMSNCFSLFLLLGIVFDRYFETICHFETKIGRRFEFILMSLIRGVITF